VGAGERAPLELPHARWEIDGGVGTRAGGSMALTGRASPLPPAPEEAPAQEVTQLLARPPAHIDHCRVQRSSRLPIRAP
jgi:hypothetical protein